MARLLLFPACDESHPVTITDQAEVRCTTLLLWGMQALQRARGTPGFARRAVQAQQAYQEQAQRATHAVAAWASQHGFETGTELRWCRRS